MNEIIFYLTIKQNYIKYVKRANLCIKNYIYIIMF